VKSVEVFAIARLALHVNDRPATIARRYEYSRRLVFGYNGADTQNIPLRGQHSDPQRRIEWPT